jgi:aminopeptidase N
MKRLLFIAALGWTCAATAADNKYDLTLTLGEQVQYQGRETLTLNFENNAPGTLRLQFAGGRVTSALINSEPAQVRSSAGRLELSGPALKNGQNTVQLDFEHPYVTDGSGLHAWKDPKDGKTYVYSQLQGEGRDTVFPVLEGSRAAPLKLTVNTPKEWALSADDGNLRAFSLYAGRFNVSEFKSAAGVPVRLLVPQSMTALIPAQEWFATAQLALVYYPWYLKTPYPLKKYDQVILAPLGRTPEEVTRAIFKDVASRWLGKYVAINDSGLLTLLAYQGVKEATPFVASWENFFLNEKQGAYSEAAALREVFFALGPQAMQDGWARFFQDYGNKSATIRDVFTALEAGSHRSLKGLEQQWLHTKGLSTVTPQFECMDGKISSFSITQSPPLRAHVSELALYKNDKVTRTIRIAYAQGRTELGQLQGQACPDAVFLNVEDYDYIKEVFEPNTLTALETGIDNLADPFYRLKGWMALWEQVQAKKLPSETYLVVVLNGLAHEQDQLVTQYVLSTLCPKGDEQSCLRAKKALPPPPRSEYH